jgi:hypothetical protein
VTTVQAEQPRNRVRFAARKRDFFPSQHRDWPWDPASHSVRTVGCPHNVFMVCLFKHRDNLTLRTLLRQSVVSRGTYWVPGLHPSTDVPKNTACPSAGGHWGGICPFGPVRKSPVADSCYPTFCSFVVPVTEWRGRFDLAETRSVLMTREGKAPLRVRVRSAVLLLPPCPRDGVAR